MLAFWFVYSIRLIFDLEVNDQRYLETNAFYVYSWAFGVCLIPAIATYKISGFFEIAQSLKVCFLILFCSNLCLMFGIFSFGNWNITEILLSRANVNIEIEGEVVSLVNPISVGFHGEVLALLAIFLINFPIWKSKFYSVLMYTALILGMLNLVLGASRGPLFAFVLILLFEVYLIGKYKNFNLSFIARFLTISILVIIGCVFVVSNNTEDVQLFSRFSGMYEERLHNVKEERDYEWESAVNQFLDNPVLGDAFVTDYDKSYCHNIILDVLMSTGLLGGMLFFTFFIFLISKLNYLVKRAPFQPHLSAYVVLFLSALLGSTVSGGLFNIYPFWLLSAFILGIQLNNIQNNIVIN